MKTLTGAQAVVECLKAEGVEFVFGIPGGQTLSIMDVLYETPEIRFITTRHELAAAHMADAYGRLTGKPGVCLVTTGPGATNLLTGVGGALRDSSPALFLTVNNKGVHLGQDDNQEADHVALFTPLTKWSRLAMDARSIPGLIREAFRHALSGCPGPVHLDFTRDAVEEGSVDFEPLAPGAYRPVLLPAPDPQAIQAAARLLLEAERPLCWVGKGCILSGAGDAVMALARELSIPVITTYNGMGAVPGDHPLVFGPRSRGGTALTLDLIREADCLLTVGNSLNAASTSRWSIPIPDRLIQVDIDPMSIGRHYPCAVGVVADARAAVDAIRERARGQLPAAAHGRRGTRLRGLEADRAAWREKAFAPDVARAVPIKPQAIMQALMPFLTDTTVVVADAGNPGIWSHLLLIRRPRSYMKPVGYGNMGFGLPGAIAAKLCRPAETVFALVGDGSLGMALAEIETAVRLRTPLTLVVMNDLAYGNIRQEQLVKFGPRSLGVDLGETDYAAVARAMGADGERVDRPEQLTAALERGVRADRLYLLDVRIDPEENVWRTPF